jgi:hypothetical protein
MDTPLCASSTVPFSSPELLPIYMSGDRRLPNLFDLWSGERASLIWEKKR